MVIYILRRIVWAVVVLLVVTALTFAIFYLLPPGDPALRFVGRLHIPFEAPSVDDLSVEAPVSPNAKTWQLTAP